MVPFILCGSRIYQEKDFFEFKHIYYHNDEYNKSVKGRFQYFSDARMWTQCTPKNWIKFLPSVACFLNNLASQQKADHFCGGRDMSSLTYQK